jgi:hypothetical protein
MPCPIPVNSALRAAAVGSTHCRPVTVAGGQQSRGGLLLLRNRYRWCVWHTSRPSPARPGAAPGELSPQAASSAARFAELRSGWTEFVTRVYSTGPLWVGGRRRRSFGGEQKLSGRIGAENAPSCRERNRRTSFAELRLRVTVAQGRPQSPRDRQVAQVQCGWAL